MYCGLLTSLLAVVAGVLLTGGMVALSEVTVCGVLVLLPDDVHFGFAEGV